MSRFIHWLTATLAMLMCLAVQAEVYKCTDAEGGLTFQQTPCPEQKVEKVRSAAMAPAAVDCSYAGKFSISTSRLMRGGAGSDEVFNRYGGLNSLSRATIGVINYVYSFRTSEDVTIERIAGLAEAKCRARSFGDASCEQLPLSFTESIGGCDAKDGEREVADASSAAARVMGQPEQGSTAAPARSGTPGTRSPVATAQCKKGYRDAIDEIDARMRQGYSAEQGEVYRERLRGLTEGLRDC